MLTLFILTVILTPYFLYSLAAQYFNWRDRRQKTAVEHANELCSATILGVAIYFVGGYNETFHWIIPPIAICITLSYGFAAEYKALQTSLLYIKKWKWQMWSIVGFAICLILGFAILHVHFAIQRWGQAIALYGYFGCFLLTPIFAACLVWALKATENDTDSDYQALEETEETHRMMGSPTSQNNESDELDTLEEGHGLQDLPPAPIPSSDLISPRKQLILHLHHYQIFAYITLFTRFPTVWSRVAAALSLGSMMHGISAYGLDSIFVYRDRDVA